MTIDPDVATKPYIHSYTLTADASSKTVDANWSTTTTCIATQKMATLPADGVWSQPSGTAVGSALNTSTGILKLNGLVVGIYVFRYTVTGTTPCPNDTEDISVTINACCPPSICFPINVVRN